MATLGFQCSYFGVTKKAQAGTILLGRMQDLLGRIIQHDTGLINQTRLVDFRFCHNQVCCQYQTPHLSESPIKESSKKFDKNGMLHAFSTRITESREGNWVVLLIFVTPMDKECEYRKRKMLHHIERLLLISRDLISGLYMSIGMISYANLTKAHF